MKAAWSAEWLKLRRSRVPWMTVLAISVGAAAGGLFMFISLHPGRAGDLGLLGAKAQLSTLEPSWPSFFGLLAQITAVGGVIIFGITVVWMFGREFADHTAKDLLALPTHRAAIVAAKFAAATVWCLLLAVYLTAAGLGIGLLLGIPGPLTVPVAAAGVGRIFVTAVLTIAITTLFGLAASVGRGYLPGVAVLFAVVFTAQIVAALGYGAWFPFSVPAMHAGLTGADGPSPVGYAAVGAMAFVAVTATIGWWQRADHTG
ncbi:ABC transporter permease [Allorhizocola rhizosphaerae]|uniref:ABC transporter permease n=1 Tax=Allorhizocola rhizosphaerae TaxID=1872709 RepID=UPI000E3CEC6B|nr:ABC transporter permease [Allorhizocola rhizosphaerae]